MDESTDPVVIEEVVKVDDISMDQKVCRISNDIHLQVISTSLFNPCPKNPGFYVSAVQVF